MRNSFASRAGLFLPFIFFFGRSTAAILTDRDTTFLINHAYDAQKNGALARPRNLLGRKTNGNGLSKSGGAQPRGMTVRGIQGHLF